MLDIHRACLYFKTRIHFDRLVILTQHPVKAHLFPLGSHLNLYGFIQALPFLG